MTGLVRFRSVYFIFLCLSFRPSNTSSQFENELQSLRNETQALIKGLRNEVIRQEKLLIAQQNQLDKFIKGSSPFEDFSDEDQHSLKNAVGKLEAKFDRYVSQIASNKSSTTLAAKTTPVCFTVVREINGHGVFTAIGKMPYERALLNLGNAMNITTGEFTAPIRGIYFFSLTICSNINSWAKIFHNDVTVVLAETHGCNGCTALNSGSAQATIELNVGDIVYTYLGNGHLWENMDRHSMFTGFLLHEL